MSIIGIDLGTTNTLATFWKDGKCIPVRNGSGDISIPSAVSIGDDGSVLVGKIAEERLISHPGLSASEFKRNIGSGSKIILGDTEYTAAELSSLVLKKVLEDAQKELDEPVTEAVISVPAYFDDSARSATKLAASLAGLNVKRLVNEPSAAALAYIHKNKIEDGTYMIIDIGGGTFDASVVDTFDGVVEILAVAGDNMLGGKDFNECIVRYFCSENNIDYEMLSAESKAVLYKNAENCKKALSDVQQAIMIANIKNVQYSITLDNNTLIRISSDLFDRMAVPVKKVLHDSRCSAADLDDVILVGGTCKMPVVKAFIKRLFKRDPCCDINPDTAVAYGAGVFAGIKDSDSGVRDIVLTDICPFSIGISAYNTETREDLMDFIIHRNTTLPASRMKKFSALSENQKLIRLRIYQGESMLPSKNKLIGEFDINCSETKKGNEICEVRLTYDINGILMVDVTTASDGVSHTKTIVSSESSLSEKELEEVKEKMNKAKLSRENDQENALLIARAERMFEEALPAEREIIIKALISFKASLSYHNNHELRLAGKKLKEILDMIGGMY